MPSKHERHLHNLCIIPLLLILINPNSDFGFLFLPPSILYTYAVNLNNVFFSYVRVYFIYVYFWCLEWLFRRVPSCLQVWTCLWQQLTVEKQWETFIYSAQSHPLSSIILNHVLWREIWAKWDEKPLQSAQLSTSYFLGNSNAHDI